MRQSVRHPSVRAVGRSSAERGHAPENRDLIWGVYPAAGFFEPELQIDAPGYGRHTGSSQAQLRLWSCGSRIQLRPIMMNGEDSIYPQYNSRGRKVNQLCGCRLRDRTAGYSPVRRCIAGRPPQMCFLQLPAQIRLPAANPANMRPRRIKLCPHGGPGTAFQMPSRVNSATGLAVPAFNRLYATGRPGKAGIHPLPGNRNAKAGP
jgi:hypothetical protein